MSESARFHFVERLSSMRTVCGVSLDSGADERMPLVFGNSRLWASFAGLGTCRRCSVWVLELDASCAKCGHAKGDHSDWRCTVHGDGKRCLCDGFERFKVKR